MLADKSDTFDILQFISVTEDALDEHSIGTDGEHIAKAWVQFFGTYEGRMAIRDLMVRGRVFDHLLPDEGGASSDFKQGARQLVLEILGLIKVGEINERRRFEHSGGG